MAGKRGNSGKPNSGGGNGASSSPWGIVLLLAGSVGAAAWALVQRGGMEWPPRELISGAFTITGGLALAGPIALWLRGSGDDRGLGERIWMTCGLLAWLFNIAGAVQGDVRPNTLISPIPPITLGLFALAIALGGWKGRSDATNWSWTNVLGWMLGLFWIGLAAWTLFPDSSTPALARSIRL
jgi:hypothetical protein